MRILLVASVVCTIASPAAGQDAFPLAGRWAFFDFGERDLPADAVANACRDNWESFSPDGSFNSFRRDDFDEVMIGLAGFCEMVGENRISCTHLLDETGPISETYVDEISWVSPEIVDYLIRREDGKPDVEYSWTYVRCPADIRAFR